MSYGKLIGNVIGAAIVLGVTKKYVLDPLYKKKKKKNEVNYEDLFNLKWLKGGKHGKRF